MITITEWQWSELNKNYYIFFARAVTLKKFDIFLCVEKSWGLKKDFRLAWKPMAENSVPKGQKEGTKKVS